MLFNSYIYIFIFFPLTLLAGTVLGQLRKASFKAALVVVSVVFYGWMDIKWLPLFSASMVLNFLIAGLLASRANKRPVLIAGIAANVAFLLLFKYTNWIISNLNYALDWELSPLNLVFPAGISFYTFTQISYLVDLYRGEAEKTGLLDYALFVSFFPKVMQGPIARYKEIAPQLGQAGNFKLDHRNIAEGLLLFSIGLFKKVIIADTLAGPVGTAFDVAQSLDFVESWVAVLAYTFQIYFDFSGYTDMALGSALMLNVHLPVNFLSPYKSRNLQEFWQKWHITLGAFLRDFLYKPLGGSRNGLPNTCRNLVITFLIAGMWHGAGWNFILWGLMHGIGLAIHRVWKLTRIRLPYVLSWAVTFLFVCFSWIFFRAQAWTDAIKVLKGCLGLSGIVLPSEFSSRLSFLKIFGVNFDVFLSNIGLHRREFFELLLYLTMAAVLSFFASNSIQITRSFSGRIRSSVFASILIVCSILNMHKPTGFLYFSF